MKFLHLHPPHPLSRFNNNQRHLIIVKLLDRDGLLCQGIVNGKRCLHRFSDVDEIRVDHIDGNPNNNPSDYSNYRLVCNSCNFHMSLEMKKLAYQVARQAPAHVSEQTDVSTEVDEIFAAAVDKQAVEQMQAVAAEVERQDAEDKARALALEADREEAALTPTMRKNRKVKKPFNDWLDERLAAGDQYPYKDWVNAGAHLFDCSDAMIMRFLDYRLNPINGDLYDATINGKNYLAKKRW